MQMRRFPAIRIALVVAAAGLLGGCAGGSTSAGNSSASNSYASIGSGPTVTFESIDGPPPQVFTRMVGLLDAESKTRNLLIVSRDAAAAYRVRSYLSAQIQRGRTTIAWVWDVYDRDGQRALRLSGEEAAGKSGRDAWASADDAVLRRIAQAGLAGLGGVAGAGAPADPQPAPPALRGPAIASADDASGTAALSFNAH